MIAGQNLDPNKTLNMLLKNVHFSQQNTVNVTFPRISSELEHFTIKEPDNFKDFSTTNPAA